MSRRLWNSRCVHVCGCVILGVRWRCKGGGEGGRGETVGCYAYCGIELEMDTWSIQTLTLGLAIASTRSCNNFDPSTTRTLDKEQDSSMRWWRWAIGAPTDLHQRRQTADQLVYILRSTFRKFYDAAVCPKDPAMQQKRKCLVYYQAWADFALQAQEHHRKYLESLPSTSYPLEPTGARAEINESQRVSDEPLGQR